MGCDEHNHHEDDDRLRAVAVINLLGFVVELIGGLAFGSVALLSDAFHMLFDAIAYIMAYTASTIAKRYDNDRLEIEAHRLEPLAAFVNGVLLLPMVGYILWESYNRFVEPSDISVIPVILVGTLGLAVNLASIYVLNDDNLSLNEKGAFYHLLGDAGGSIAVILSAVVINFSEATVIDPIVAVLIGVLILWSAAKIMLGSGYIFLHKTKIDRKKSLRDIESIELIDRVVCLHTWQVCSQITVATLHARTNEGVSQEDEDELESEVHKILSEYGVNHATVEIRNQFTDENCLMTHNH
jgi:cobalt-zinc-cadmium efflux system protein